MVFYFQLLLLWCCIGISSAVSINPRNNKHHTLQGAIAKTNLATFVGNTDPSYGVDSWLGVHYGKSPTGNLRLQPPVLFQNTGVVNSQQYGDRCFQIGTTVANTSEDCLVLNIYAPSKRHQQDHWKHKKSGLPVMLWIHGGGYNQGSGNNYNGELLVRRSIELRSPVIVISINYRLSFFGFSGNSRPFGLRNFPFVFELTISSGYSCNCQERSKSWASRSTSCSSMGTFPHCCIWG
jgi:hypothetical protein